MADKRKDWEELLRECFKHPEHRVAGWDDVKGTEPGAVFKRLLFKYSKPGRAHTISLSDDLVWAVSELSRKLDPMYLYEKVMNTRLPFPVTVFEWKGEVRRLAYQSMKVNQEVSEEHPDHEVPAIMVAEKENGGKFIRFLSYDYEARSMIFFPVMFDVLPEDHSNPDNSLTQVLKNSGGDPAQVLDFMFTTVIVQKNPDLHKILEDPRLDVRVSGPLWGSARTMKPRQRIGFLFAGVSGQFRWLGALLALLDRPAMTRYVDTILADPAAQAASKGVQKATSQNQTLTLLLPREKVVTKVVHLTEHERKKVGLHEVAGHWCYSHKRGDPNCHHVWPNQPTLRQICERCGAVRWRREAHERGQGETLKHKKRRATFTGMSVERLTEAMKEEAKT